MDSIDGNDDRLNRAYLKQIRERQTALKLFQTKLEEME